MPPVGRTTAFGGSAQSRAARNFVAGGVVVGAEIEMRLAAGGGW